MRRLSLDIHEAELDLDCVTTQGIQIGVRAVVIYKIADDFASIANAARRFLDQEDQLDVKVHNVFAGHLRAIVGTMTVEDLIRNRDALTRATRESSASEMQRLGLTIDSLQIQEIVDHSNYIENVSMPEAARVVKEARIAQSQADREATEREQESEALKAAARSKSQIQQAEVMAEAQRAQAAAEQAGPLAAARARQQVVVQETKVAELEAERTEQKLQAEVRRPADAEAYKQRTLAEGERDARISQARPRPRRARSSSMQAPTRSASSSRRRRLRPRRRRRRSSPGARPCRGGGDQGSGRRACLEPGSGDRTADRGAAAGDRRGGLEGLLEHRSVHRPERRRGRGSRVRAGARARGLGDPDAARDARTDAEHERPCRAVTARGTTQE